MTDSTHTDSTTDAPSHEEAVEVGQHPHAGVSQEGFSSPQQDATLAEGQLAKLVLKRHGAETDIEFPLNPPSIIGRFDPSIGPIDVDLGSLDEGSYVSRKHAKIECDNGAWKITDLGSSNGTFVLRGGDFERVQESDLTDGLELALGNARFVFRFC